MTKLLLLLLANFAITFSFSQQRESNEIKKIEALDAFRKEYDVRSVFANHQVDSITYIINAQVNQKGIVYMMLFKADYNPEDKNYSFVKLDHTPFEVYKSINHSYLKRGKQIYCFRKKEEKNETLFYLDELVGNRFEAEREPFFKGSNEYSGSSSIFSRRNSFIAVTKKKVGSIISAITISEFSLNNLELITTDVTVIPKVQKVKELDHFENDQMLVHYYQYSEEKKGKVAGIVLAEGKITHLKLEDGSDPEITCKMYSNENDLFLSVVTRNTDDLKAQLYAADLQNASFTKIADSPIPLHVLSKGYPEPFEKKKLKTRGLTFNVSDVIVEDIDKIYVILYSTMSADNRFTVMYIDLLILKFSENELLWAQQIRRAGNQHPRYFCPEIVLENQELKIHDLERVKSASNLFNSEFGLTSISLDTESGKIMK